MLALRSVVWLAAVGVLCLAERANAQNDDACIAANDKSIALRKQGKLIDARRELATCAADACPDIVKTECRNRVQEINGVIPGIVFDVKDASGNPVTQIRITMDGAPLTDHLDGTAIEINPGKHDFSFEVAGQLPVTKSFMIPEGEKAHRETVALGPASMSGTGGTGEQPKPETPTGTPGESSHGGAYLQVGIGASWMYFPDNGSFNTYDWAGFRPDIEFGLHVTGRFDGFVIGLRQAFLLTAVQQNAGGVSQLRLGYDIPIAIGARELSIDPFAVVGIGYIFDGFGFGGPSAGIAAGGGVDAKFFVAGGFYVGGRIEAGAQCFHDVGLCAFTLSGGGSAGFAFGGK